jgi:hypothetical protein
MRLGLCQIQAYLLSQGPTTNHVLHHTNGTTTHRGPEARQQVLDDLAVHLHRVLAEALFWPGDHLVPPPSRAAVPYQPYRPALR